MFPNIWNSENMPSRHWKIVLICFVLIKKNPKKQTRTQKTTKSPQQKPKPNPNMSWCTISLEVLTLREYNLL